MIRAYADYLLDNYSPLLSKITLLLENKELSSGEILAIDNQLTQLLESSFVPFLNEFSKENELSKALNISLRFCREDIEYVSESELTLIFGRYRYETINLSDYPELNGLTTFSELEAHIIKQMIVDTQKQLKLKKEKSEQRLATKQEQQKLTESFLTDFD